MWLADHCSCILHGLSFRLFIVSLASFHCISRRWVHRHQKDGEFLFFQEDAEINQLIVGQTRCGGERLPSLQRNLAILWQVAEDRLGKAEGLSLVVRTAEGQEWIHQ